MLCDVEITTKEVLGLRRTRPNYGVTLIAVTTNAVRRNGVTKNAVFRHTVWNCSVLATVVPVRSNSAHCIL